MSRKIICRECGLERVACIDKMGNETQVCCDCYNWQDEEAVVFFHTGDDCGLCGCGRGKISQDIYVGPPNKFLIQDYEQGYDYTMVFDDTTNELEISLCDRCAEEILQRVISLNIPYIIDGNLT